MAGRSVLLLLAGAMLGVVATLVARPAGRSVGGDSEATGVASPSRDLEALRSDVLALRELIERQRALPPAATGDAPLPLTDADPLMTQLDALRTELKALTERIEAQSDESRTALADLRTALEAAASGPEPMPASLPETPLNLPALNQISDRPEEDVTNEHILWTYDQVMGTYGRPTRVQPNPSTSGGGIKFLYELPGGGTCIFWFKSGRVVRVFP
jgi:hypothetical protein